MAKLTSENVHEMAEKCLFKQDEKATEGIVVRGIMIVFVFHPGRLEENRAEIMEMLSELPDTFKQTGGGGWTFLNACEDKNRDLWTGDQRIMDLLVCLGIGTGQAKYQFPRDMWPNLPGGLPYFVVLDKYPEPMKPSEAVII